MSGLTCVLSARYGLKQASGVVLDLSMPFMIRIPSEFETLWLRSLCIINEVELRSEVAAGSACMCPDCDVPLTV